MTTTSSRPTVRPPGRLIDCGFGFPLPGDLLVRLGNVNDFLDPRQSCQAGAVHPPIVAHQPHGRALSARHGARLVSHLLDGGSYPADLFFRCAVTHDDQHESRESGVRSLGSKARVWRAKITLLDEGCRHRAKSATIGMGSPPDSRLLDSYLDVLLLHPASRPQSSTPPAPASSPHTPRRLPASSAGCE